ncbi:amino acid adenylation domain-containing protein [Corallococcus sp. CA047B]|uniref:amino acid adenylation domain-containing protein n=1 Tax=Corallococcus sp. CA047B TaxID=2316729 RepID=UPI000EA14E8E|nr:non-ribosomal peptide synthetase [Corallococcus sp. CA047B]RKH15280.1 amino acid adenylation domain-containing protein [Corallococcus sp. CA047B]
MTPEPLLPDASVSFWQQHLAGAPALLELPTDRPRPPAQRLQGGSFPWTISASLTAALEALALREAVPLFVPLLAGYSALLHRYSRQDDLVVGASVARTDGGVLALRQNLFGNPRFVELMARVHAIHQAAETHRALPFEKLVGALPGTQGFNHAPVFQVMFVFAPLADQPADTQRARCDLVLSVSKSQEGLRATFEYDTDLFDSERIQRMASHLQTFLEAAVAQPSRPIAALPLLPDAERQRVLHAWNDATADFPRDVCVHERFALQASLTPDAPAVTYGALTLSYRQLDERSNQLAWHLRSLGVGPEVLVGLCVERSVDLIVGMLAVLKAGGAYLPLDSSHPAERLAFMLQDARVGVLLVHQQKLEHLPPFSGATVVLDSSATAEVLDQQPTQGLPRTSGPENLAYVIFTSGSTGRPKGSAIFHRGILALAFDALLHPFAASDRVAQASNISFDPSTFEIWGALLHGAHLIGITANPAHSPHEFVAQVQDARVSTMFLTTAVLHLLARQVPAAFSALDTLVFGGEAADPLALREILQHGPPKRLVNGYGPTECTVFSSFHLVDSAPPLGIPVSIGGPLSNGPLFLLDAHLHPVPIGIPGELYVSGERLGRGYFNRPELTARIYLPNPFSSVPGARLYKTGDLARFLPDGRIEYLGRADHQVKVRGYRVELGEIEEALRLHPAIKDASVIAREAGGDRRLAAYLVPHNAVPAVSELRAWLRERLPEHMVPASFTPLAALPLTVNGKVDRRALPAPEPARGDALSYVPPRTPTEVALCRLWASLLDVERVSLTDNFFHLGGHSLLATQLVSRVNETFHLRLPIRRIFEAPTLVVMAEAIETARRTGISEEGPPLVAFPHEGDQPLSFAQERLLFVEQLHPGHATYRIPVSYRITSPLDVEVLERSLTELTRRHEALRTVFAATETAFVTRIQPVRPFALQMVDVRNLSASEQAAEAARYAREELERPMELVSGPLFQGTLLRLGEQEHLLLLTIHHIVSDGWSLGVLLRELRTVYEDFSAGRPSSLPPLPIQYVEFGVWQRQWLRDDTLERLFTYWSKQLEGAPLLLELPMDRPRPPIHRFRGKTLTFGLSPAVSQGIEDLCRQESVTLFMGLLAGFSALLHRYSGQQDLIVGAPIAGRIRPEIEGIVGLFVNTLALRQDLSGNPSFIELMRRAREVTLGAYAHQDLPFEKLVEHFHPERSLSHALVVQVMFVLQNAPVLEVQPSAALQMTATAEPWELSTGTSKCDLILFMSKSPEGLRATFEYDTDLFDSERIQRMASHLQTLLEAAVAQPSRPIASLPLLPKAERQRVLHAWNDATVEFPQDVCVHERFALQASLTPDAPAVTYGDLTLSYRQLDERSNQFAWHLRSLGVGPEVLVGLCVERSPDLIIGMLAVLKAGGAYLPLDASHPAERLAFMLQDARVSVLLVHEHKRQQLPAFSGATVCIDTEAEALSRLSSAPLPRTSGPENLAYVIFTSGSTGRPKGSAILHRGILALAFDPLLHPFAASDRVAQASNASFDPSTFEIWGALLHGAHLVGITANPAHSPHEFAAQVRDTQVSVMFVTTAVLHLLARQVPGAFSGLKTLVFGGEAADPLALREVLTHGPPQRLVNGYGPTECTVFSSFHLVDAPPALGFPVPIGGPLTNGPLYLLDGLLQPVPIGVPGELYVSGERLGRGYFNRPELTARIYLPNPFSSVPGARLYKTGDLARFLPDGRIEYLGRADHQVKVRGYRVELGEIEEALRLHPAIKDASVIAREAGGDRRLAAYLVPHDAVPDVSELRAWLRERLPEHMVPASFTPLAALPLTVNGKVDRRALPAPEPARGDALSYVPPRTPTEVALCRLWASLLDVERVGLHDNFFHLGGHSLLATQLVSRIRAELGAELALRVLFTGPTVAEMAQHLGTLVPDDGPRAVPPLVRAPRDRALPLSYSQERLYRFFLRAPTSSAYNIPIGFRIRGPVRVGALRDALQGLLERHESMRVKFSEKDGQLVQRITPAGEFPWRFEDLRGQPDAEAAAWRHILADAATPFDLTRDPLVRASLLCVKDDEHLLLICVHHISADGWSMGVIARELGALYSARVEGRESDLAPLVVQYPDYAAWQRAWLTGTELSRRLAYWQQSLAGAPTELQLPTDRPRPPVRTFNGTHREVHLGRDRSDALHALCRRENVTPFMAMLSAFGVVLARRSGQEEVVIGSPIANRLLPELEPLIGMFVNGLCLRVSLRGSPGFRTLLQRVREETLGAYAHQEVPVDQIVVSLGVELPVNRSPVFQVMFVLQNAPEAPFELPGLTVTPVEVNRGSVTYELALSFTEMAGGFSGVLEFNTDLFDARTAEGIHADFIRVLDAVLANPDLPMGLDAQAS